MNKSIFQISLFHGDPVGCMVMQNDVALIESKNKGRDRTGH